MIGPVPCQGCRRPVLWTTSRSQPECAPHWRNGNLSQHRCQAHRIDPELGPMRTCPACREEWPLDDEFYERLGGKGGYFRSTCRSHHRWGAA